MAKKNGKGGGIIERLVTEEKKPLSVSLDESVAAALDQYCTYVNRPKGDVVQRMIMYVMEQDAGYQEYRHGEAPRQKKQAKAAAGQQGGA